MAISNTLLRLCRPQISLRGLLVFTTLVAITLGVGMAWWRKPFTVARKTIDSGWKHEELIVMEEYRRTHELGSKLVIRCGCPSAQPTYVYKPTEPRYKVVARVYRNLSGEHVRHGKLTVCDLEGRRLREELWRHGKLHGKWTDWHPDGSVIARGEYDRGEKHGEWARFRELDGLFSRSIRQFEFYRQGELRSSVWNDEGARTVEHYRQGACWKHTHWNADGQMVTDVTARGNVTHRRRWYASGEELEDVTTRGDLTHAQSWYRCGQRAEEVFLCDGRRIRQSRGWHGNGTPLYRGAWKDGLEHGRWTWWDDDGTVRREAEFRAGRLIDRNGEPFPAIAQQTSVGSEMNKSILAVLDRPVEAPFFNETPLTDVMTFFKDLHEIPIAFHQPALRVAGIQPDDVLITLTASPAPTYSLTTGGVTLRAALQVILEPLELVPVIRHGILLITTRDDAMHWTNQTGVDSIRKDPLSRFQKEFAEPTEFAFHETPLSDVVQFIADFHLIAVRLNPSTPANLADTPVTASIKGTSLAAALGYVLDQHGLKCTDRGTTLLIGPRE